MINGIGSTAMHYRNGDVHDPASPPTRPRPGERLAVPVTARARIGQDDIDRVVKVLVERETRTYRLVLDLRNERIEVIVGESTTPPAPADNPWDRE